MPKVLGRKNGDLKAQVELGRIQFNLTYLVLADTQADTPQEILAAPTLPGWGTRLHGAYCLKRDTREKTRCMHPVTGVPTILWEVNLKFGSKVDPRHRSDGEAGEENLEEPPEPWDWRPRVEWSGEQIEDVLEKDAITGAPIVTFNDEKILVSTQQAIPVLQVQRYERWPFDPQVQLAWANHTNSEPFYGAPAGCAWLQPIQSIEMVIEKWLCVQATYTIKFNLKFDVLELAEDGWNAQPLHAGYVYFDHDANPFLVRNEIDGRPTKCNLSLDDGSKLASSEPAEFLNFNRFPRGDFNNLSLGPF